MTLHTLPAFVSNYSRLTDGEFLQCLRALDVLQCYLLHGRQCRSPSFTSDVTSLDVYVRSMGGAAGTAESG